MHQPGRARFYLLSLVMLFILVFQSVSAVAEQTPLVDIPVSVNWDNVPEDKIPEQLTVLLTPDGVSFMATNLMFNAEMGWKGNIQTIGGTRTIAITVPPLEGLEYRLLGSVEEGYTIEYHPEGKIPEDDARLADQSVNPAKVSHAEVETSLVSKPAAQEAAPDLPAIETSEGEILSQEELERRMVAAALKEQGITAPNRTLYIVGIIVCAILIVLAIIARILLGRRQEG